ncbi:hypothetical protein [Janibacter corallicola]|uniref:hypothetical protein n=1 Tax=Janibacter corallicola TaxID=415212 RepID=UPI00082D3620|nr:hypothetical protein [Janibacter corallicola]
MSRLTDALRDRLVDAVLDPRRRDLVAGTPFVRAAREGLVAGEELDDAVAEAVRLRRTHRLAALHPLLPDATGPEDVEHTVAEAIDAVTTLAPHTAGGDIHAEIYLGPEQLGIGFDQQGARAALERVCEVGDEHSVDITLRSGPAELADRVLDLASAVHHDHPRLTASLVARRHRSEGDAARLVGDGVRVRLVRGGAGDPRSVAWQDPHEVDLAFARCLAILYAADLPTVVATHDPLLLDLADGLADQTGRGPQGLEYQFFHGIQSELQMRTADAGHRVRILVPYGPEWFPYLRDLAHRATGTRIVLDALRGA